MIHITDMSWLPVAKLWGIMLSVVVVLWGCGSGEKKAVGIPDAPPCPERMSPVPVIEPVFTVGEGTPSSCDENALREAMALAGAGGSGSILFDCGPEPHVIHLTSALEVSGTLLLDGENRITLDGGQNSRILSCAHHTRLTVQRMELANGRTEDSGAAIHQPWFGELVVIDVGFTNNVCTSTAPEIGGGGVFAGGLTKAVFSGCTFTGNRASNGGGIFNRSSTLTVLHSTFVDNETTSSGGGGQVGNGGAIYIDGMWNDPPGRLLLCGSVFRENKGRQHGSALFGYFYAGSAADIHDCVFEDNRFLAEGSGTLYHQGVHLTLSRSLFAGNTSLKHASGLFVGSGSTADVINCTFADNHTPEVGAAIFNGASTVRVVNSTFSGNSADYAPAVFSGENARMSYRNCIFSGNTTENRYSALHCNAAGVDEGGNIQWPENRNSGSPDTPCAAGTLFADPQLTVLGDHGGFSRSHDVSAQSPALLLGRNCPKVDQRGVSRAEPCTSGAIEK